MQIVPEMQVDVICMLEISVPIENKKKTNRPYKRSSTVEVMKKCIDFCNDLLISVL